MEVDEDDLTRTVRRGLLDPLFEFFRLEAASGIVLFASAVVALAWANSPWASTYRSIFARPVELAVGRWHLAVSLEALIGDGLMSLFFFVVGMEIKRELVAGELRTLSKAMLPAIAAFGGMAVPALIFWAFNPHGPEATGWAIPVATDIAFAIGCLTLLKDRVPNALVVFLTALAIFDDLGGVLVIALFYGQGLQAGWLAAAAGVALGIVGLARFRRALVPLFVAGGVLLWLTVHASGIHATIAGVLLGFLVPARSRGEERAPIARFEHALHPWVAFGVMPLFALASSGLALQGARGELLSTVSLGAGLGLLIGKQLGIFCFTMAAVRLGLAEMPGGSRPRQLYGVAVIGGIGFTVALFIASLAYPADPELLVQAKLGILLGSLSSGVLGTAILRATSPRSISSRSARTSA